MSTLKSNGDPQSNRIVPLNPVKFYGQVVRRLFLLYRHVLGLFVGGLFVYVEDYPAYKRKFFRSAVSRATTFLLRPFVRKDLRTRPFEVQLRRRLELLGPTYVKLGQIMAIREDILPRNVTEELKKLLDRLPGVKFTAIRAIIENSFGKPVEELFDSIEKKPIGTASIAQTHLATTKDGETVVLKVIKPGIREVVLYDIRLLQILGRLLNVLIPQYQPGVIINEFCIYTEKEVDLTFEADHAALFAANFHDEPDIVFPKIRRDLSSSDVLCMEFFDGIKPTDERIFELSDEAQDRIVDLGTGAIIKMLYQDGFFHADLHAGNLMVLPGPKVGFIDLGMVGRFDRKIRLNMLYYFYALVDGDIEGSTKYLLAMAKIGKRGDPVAFKRSVADLLRRFLIKGTHGDLSLAQLILESLAIGGRYRVFFPVEMTLMVKALVTFEGVGRQLKPSLDIPALSRKHIRKIYASHYDPAQLMRSFMRGVPEFIDVIVRLPELLSTGSRSLEDFLSQGPADNPLAGLRSSLMAGACIVGGTIAVVANGPPFLWAGLFLSSVIFFFSGK